MTLPFRERAASGDAAGLLVLHHGRGTDERDLLPAADVLDPDRRLHVVTPRAPLQLPGSPGYHWYVVERVGYPDPETFDTARAELTAFHDELWERTGLTPAQTVLGGFSMGAVISYTMALSADRPPPKGILAFSGFIPALDTWQPELQTRNGILVFIAHGRRDPVIGIEFARRARELLTSAGFEVDYRESDAAHNIDPHDIPRAVAWLRAAVT